MKLAYGRVSRDDQNLDLQRDAFAKEGVDRVYLEKASGAKDDRPELARMMDALREGDTLVVWRLDRLGRNMKHLIATVEELERRGVAFVSITEKIDTSSATGRLIFYFFASLAEFERNLLRERTKAGLAAARARGRKGGRPSLPTDTVRLAQAVRNDPTANVSEACKRLGISRQTFYKVTTPPAQVA